MTQITAVACPSREVLAPQRTQDTEKAGKSMIDLSIEQIRAAASNDLEAISAVLTALEPRIGQVANRHATTGGVRNADLFETLEQEGRIAVWECLGRFTGETVAQFFTYVDRTLNGMMGTQRRTETRRGVSAETAKRFERCLSVCAGDPYAAEREAVRPDGVLGYQRMTPDTAYAARMAWQGVDYLDAPAGSGESRTLGDVVADSYGVPDDLLEPADIDRARRSAVRTAVHATLDRMGRQQAYVLRATFGIDPVPHMERDAEIAEALEIGEHRITVLRSKGKDRFRSLYLAGAADAGQVTA